jgi:hypothetical protein
MKKCLIGLIVGIIFAALIISGVVYLSKPKTEWETYESKEWGFKVKYPVNWRITEEGGRALADKEIFIFRWEPPEETSFGFGTIFFVEVGEAGGRSAEEWSNKSDDIVNSLMPKDAFFEVKRTKSSLGGLPAIEDIWIYKEPNLEKEGEWLLTSKGKFIITVKEDRLYANGFSAIPMKEYEKWISTVNKIISSFEYIGEK